MARKPKAEVNQEETPIVENTEYDAYKLYQSYFESQQKQVMEYWTGVLNNMFWWTRK